MIAHHDHESGDLGLVGGGEFGDGGCALRFIRLFEVEMIAEESVFWKE